MGSRISLGNHSSIKSFTVIRCDGEVTIGDYTEISSFSVIYGCSNFKVGNKCYIGPQSWIDVSEDVVIGDHVGIGARVMIFTHGSFLPYTEGYPVRFAKVRIGNNVWMASGVFVHPGIEVGDDVFVNSKSVLRDSIPSGTIVEGFPAREICPMNKIRRVVTPEKRDDLLKNILRHFAVFIKQVHPKIEVTQNDPDLIALRLRRRNYLIVLVNSKGEVPVDLHAYKGSRFVPLLNSRDWKPGSPPKNMLAFDFTTMKTSSTKDLIHRELYLFLKRYYGIIFEFDS